MYKNRTILATLIFIFSIISVYGQNTGNLSGKITDIQTGQPLVSANIMLKGTVIGTISDMEGNYRLVKLPAGKDTIVFRYLGYKTVNKVINIFSNRTVEFNVGLSPTYIEGKQITVTAQLAGQSKAINQQLTSNTIVNVVSSDKIQELPDQNVAESIGRLPGISIQRDAGEGQKVVIRGLAPKFNSITINGVKIPATDPSNRSVDLSMISSDVLAGIEVFKSLTPDMDGDAIGGSVDLILKKAPKNFHMDIKLQDGYNSHVSQLGQYKGDFTVSDRFFNNKLGVYATLMDQRANRSSDSFTADYEFISENGSINKPTIETNNFNLIDNLEVKKRLGGSVSLDYDLGNGGTLRFNSFYSKTTLNETRRRKRYRVGKLTIERDIKDKINNTTLFSNSLSGKHDIGNFLIDWEIADAVSTNETPFSNYARFQEVGAFSNNLVITDGINRIPSAAKNDLSATWFQYGTFDPEVINDRNLTAQMNVKWQFNIGENLSGFLKFGGKFRGKKRVRNIDQYLTDYGVTDKIGQANPDKFALYRNTSILFANFVDQGFSADNFLNGRFAFGPGLDAGAINNFYYTYKSSYGLNRLVQLGDYNAGENIGAAYFMGVFNLGKKLMILPGVRAEYTDNNYTGLVGALTGNLGQNGIIKDSTGGQKYLELLPMIHVRYKILSMFDVRLAVTRSLSRPDYYNLVPYESIDYANGIINRGNTQLKHAKAWNYDVYLSYYNIYGLATMGVFYKKIRDIDYISQTRLTTGSFSGYQLIQPVNAANSTVYGIELDLETNFTFLPSPFDGIVLDVNYSHMHSETLFPFFEIGPRSPNPPYAPKIINTFRKGRMPGQADNIANVSFGYEKGKFSGRISLIYQGKSLQTVGSRSELDGFSAPFTRWDAQLSYKIFKNVSIFASFNNITNLSEGAFLGNESYPTSLQLYGWTGDLGLRYRL